MGYASGHMNAVASYTWDFSMHPRSSVHRVLGLASQAARSRAVSASSVTAGSYTKLVEPPLAVTLHWVVASTTLRLRIVTVGSKSVVTRGCPSLYPEYKLYSGYE